MGRLNGLKKHCLDQDFFGAERIGLNERPSLLPRIQIVYRCIVKIGGRLMSVRMFSSEFRVLGETVEALI